MFEYFNKKLEALLESVLEPLWTRVLAAPRRTKIAILLICGAVGSAVAYPDAPRELYTRAEAITRTALSRSQKIPLSSNLIVKTRSTTKRLSRLVQGDLLKLNVVSITPWAAAQAAAAVANMESVILDKRAITSFVRSNSVPNCACWTEIPTNTTDAQSIFISGWVMTTLADMDIPATSAEIRYVLDSQNKNGWWPIFNGVTQTQYASTYSTSWILLGLLGQKSKGFIIEQDAQSVDAAITDASNWLLSVRLKGARWKPYPNLHSSNESESISGLVLHVLHLSVPEQVAALDNEWIGSLPAATVAASDSENYYLDLEVVNTRAIDHFVQIKMPWMVIATVDAFSSGDIFERTKALLWLERVLDHESVALADAREVSWWRAEILYALRYALTKI